MKKMILLIFVLISSISNPALSDSKCFKKPSNYQDSEQKERMIEEQHESTGDPVKELLFCNMQLAYEGPHTLYDNCGCREVIKKSCSIKWDNGKLKLGGKNGASDAMCTPWIPIALML